MAGCWPRTGTRRCLPTLRLPGRRGPRLATTPGCGRPRRMPCGPGPRGCSRASGRPGPGSRGTVLGSLCRLAPRQDNPRLVEGQAHPAAADAEAVQLAQQHVAARVIVGARAPPLLADGDRAERLTAALAQ